MVSFNLPAEKYVCTDVNTHIINFYRLLNQSKLTEASFKKYLQTTGSLLQEKGETFYYYMRDKFNNDRHPLQFFFLNRVGYNGLIRFNKDGGYNTPYCREDDKLDDKLIELLLKQTADIQHLFKTRDFSFNVLDFREAIQLAGPDDLIYCDPPYKGLNSTYFGGWSENDEADLFKLLSNTPAKFIVSSWAESKGESNPNLLKWSGFNVESIQHFYRIGPKVANRNSVTEVLISNF